MLWTIAIVLFILWLAGYSFHFGGNTIHVLLVVAVILLIVQLLS